MHIINVILSNSEKLKKCVTSTIGRYGELSDCGADVERGWERGGKNLNRVVEDLREMGILITDDFVRGNCNLGEHEDQYEQGGDFIVRVIEKIKEFDEQMSRVFEGAGLQ